MKYRILKEGDREQYRVQKKVCFTWVTCSKYINYSGYSKTFRTLKAAKKFIYDALLEERREKDKWTQVWP